MTDATYRTMVTALRRETTSAAHMQQRVAARVQLEKLERWRAGVVMR
jgi:hypothetical protein